MKISSWKVCLVGYLVIALGLLIWQLYANEFFALCEFNRGACGTAIRHYGTVALIWPVKLF